MSLSLLQIVLMMCFEGLRNHKNKNQSRKINMLDEQIIAAIIIYFAHVLKP